MANCVDCAAWARRRTSVRAMCGRYVSASPPEELARYFAATPPEEDLPANYNVAPTSKVYVVRARDGHREIDSFRWGLVPFWAKDAKIGSKMINARSETVADKPAFRRAFRSRRCLVPADGFYEWKKVGAEVTALAEPSMKGVAKPHKQPFFIHRADGEPLAIAGLWERWYPKTPDGSDLPGAEPVETCTILTTSANATMAPIHDRMPALLPPAVWDEWLDPSSDADRLGRLLVPSPDHLLTFHPVSTLVNSVRNRGEELIAEVPTEQSTDIAEGV